MHGAGILVNPPTDPRLIIGNLVRSSFVEYDCILLKKEIDLEY